MIAFAYYLLKVCMCSGILFLYYYIGLRNKVFHQWNRFYLLIAVVLSMLLPLIQVTVYNYLNEGPNTALQLLQVVQSADNYVEDITITGKKSVDYDQWAVLVYTTVSFLLLVFLVKSVIRVFSIIRTHVVKRISSIRFVDTALPGTPFSFFNFIFWNRDIDLQSKTGQHIFQHELIHVKEKHTLDKIFLQLVLTVFWCNPFFWLIRRELRFIHEFIADRKSVGEHGTAAFAAMVLQSAYPKQFNSITSQFFQTSIKRRLAMLTKLQNPGLNYVSRLGVLALVAATVFAFTVRTKNLHAPVAPFDKGITVVIDAGHGVENGRHTGAQASTLHEDNIVLAIAKKISELNNNSKITIIQTRSTDEYVPLERRVEIARENKADLFISIHTSAQADSRTDSSGIEIYTSNKNVLHQKQSRFLSSVLQKELVSVYPVKPYIKQRQVGVYVLDRNECPAVLIECGYITNEKDRAFVTNAQNQEAVARKILAAIEQFAAQPRVIAPTGDTIPGKTGSKEKVKPPVVEKVIYTKVDKEATIDRQVWRKFLEDNLQSVIEEAAAKGTPPNTYVTQVTFIVGRDGSLSDFSLVKDPGYGIGDKVLEMIKNSPKWQPAVVKGVKVNSYYTQPITFVIAEEEDDTKTPSGESGVPQLKKEQAASMTKLTVAGGEVVSFQIVTEKQNGDLLSYANMSAEFDNKTKSMLSELVPGTILTFENIVVKQGDKQVRKAAVAYKVVQ